LDFDLHPNRVDAEVAPEKGNTQSVIRSTHRAGELD
jgi:hypothetical protein